MDYLKDILIIVVPGLLIFLTAYLLLKNFLDNQEKKEWMKVKMDMRKEALPYRLQAYERVILLMERINPNNMIPRVRESNMTAADLQVALIKDIRNEFEHNLSQQLYLTEDSWLLVKNAKEEIIKLINLSYGHLKPDDDSMELGRAILNALMKNESSPTDQAIRYLKHEAQQYF